MSGNEMQRGYDDTGYLSEMAEGLVSRRFASVDEAAKSVLCEEAGSNVDRLRRKFREQNWYQKGLAAHVEAEIASRGLITEPRYHKAGRRILEAFTSPFDNLRRARSGAGALIGLKPGNSTAAFSLVATVTLGAIGAGIVNMSSALTVALVACVAVLVAWADRTSETAPSRTACAHLGGFAVVIASIVAVFGYCSPNPEFTMGSSEGALATAIGLTLMGVYATSFIGTRTRLAGTRQTLEIVCLIAALSAFSQIGTAILVHDGFATQMQPALLAAASR